MAFIVRPPYEAALSIVAPVLRQKKKNKKRDCCISWGAAFHHRASVRSSVRLFLLDWFNVKPESSQWNIRNRNTT